MWVATSIEVCGSLLCIWFTSKHAGCTYWVTVPTSCSLRCGLQCTPTTSKGKHIQLVVNYMSHIWNSTGDDDEEEEDASQPPTDDASQSQMGSATASHLKRPGESFCKRHPWYIKKPGFFCTRHCFLKTAGAIFVCIDMYMYIYIYIHVCMYIYMSQETIVLP